MNKVLYTLIIIPIILFGCRSKQVARMSESVRTEHKEVQTISADITTDSTIHNYQIEVVKIYDPNSGNITREEMRESGVHRSSVIENKVETVYETTVASDTAKTMDKIKSTGKSAPIHESELRYQKEKSKTIYVAVLSVIVVVCIFGVVILGKKK